MNRMNGMPFNGALFAQADAIRDVSNVLAARPSSVHCTPRPFPFIARVETVRRATDSKSRDITVIDAAGFDASLQ